MSTFTVKLDVVFDEDGQDMVLPSEKELARDLQAAQSVDTNADKLLESEDESEREEGAKLKKSAIGMFAYQQRKVNFRKEWLPFADRLTYELPRLTHGEMQEAEEEARHFNEIDGTAITDNDKVATLLLKACLKRGGIKDVEAIAYPVLKARVYNAAFANRNLFPFFPSPPKT